MSSIHRHWRLLLVALCCTGAGAGFSAIATAGAASGKPAQTAHVAGRGHHRRGGLTRLARRAVHADVVIHTRSGFVTATLDRGKVDSVSGQQLKLTEGTKRATYKTVTLTIPASARVRDDRQRASLSAVKPGQRVLVLQAPKRTFVIARTPKAG